ncbi:MAG: four helix bundle protein, partial [Patescibacteria group bacterium]
DNFPILTKLSEGYKLWHKYFNNLPRHTKFTLGAKIDNLFTGCLELALLAGYAGRDKKPEIIRQLNAKFDALKFFLKLLWEIKGINDQKYISLSGPLAQTGKMLGGWLNFFKNKPPPQSEGN